MQIDVTKDDIGQGERQNGVSCPVAHALNRHLGYTGESLEGKIRDGVIVLNDPHRPTRVVYDDFFGGFPLVGYLPVRAVAWAKKFDEGLGVKPFSFEFSPA